MERHRRGCLRWEGDGCADSTAALLQRQGGGIIARAGRAAKGILLEVAEAPVAELLLLPLRFAEHGVAD